MDKRQKAVGLVFASAIAIIFFVVDKVWIAFVFSIPWAFLGALLILFLQNHEIKPSHQPMLLDHYLPNYQFNEIYTLDIKQSKEAVYQAIWALDYSCSIILKTLFFLRGLPYRNVKMERVFKKDVCLLDEKKNEEFVLGLIAKPWTLSGDMQKFAPQEFVEWKKPGYLKVAWNFFVKDKGSHEAILYTEIRFHCFNKKVETYFAFYWALIRPFHNIIRLIIFSLIKKEAEAKDS